MQIIDLGFLENIWSVRVEFATPGIKSFLPGI